MEDKTSELVRAIPRRALQRLIPMLLLLSPRNSSCQAFQFRLLVHSSSVAAQILPERHGGALNGPNSTLLSAQTVPTQPWLVFLCSLQVPLPLSSRRCPTIILLAPALLPAGVMSSYRPEPNAHISKHDLGLFQQQWHRLPTVHLQLTGGEQD